MHRFVFPRQRPSLVAVADGLAILAFTAVGVVSHRGALAASTLLEDALALLAGWFAVAVAVRLYPRPAPRALVLTWAIGIPVGVLLRAAALGRLDEPRQLAFLATTLVLSPVFVLIARALVEIAGRKR
jgi:Protein of unknown function (DUF3054)